MRLNRRTLLGAAALALPGLAACGPGGPAPRAPESGAGAPIPMRHARTFSVTQRDGYRIVDLRASIVTWGAAAEGPEQHMRVVLAPKSGEPPALDGDLAGAVLVRTPVERIAVNFGQVEAMLTAVGAADRLVAVGGVKSYDDAIRARALSGELGQVGYGWHSAPALDVLLARRPDVFLMAMSDLDHVSHLERANQLGVPTMPVFVDNEPHYMGKVEYVRLIGMLTGREAEADAFVADVEARVEALKAIAATQPRKRLLAAWSSGDDRWMATVRNADAALLRDANAELLLGEPDDPRRDAWMSVSTEQLLARGRDADCWIIGDPHGPPSLDPAILRHFRASREGCLFSISGRTKPEADAYDVYETGIVRPDLILGDLVRMLHPTARTEPFVYVLPVETAGP